VSTPSCRSSISALAAVAVAVAVAAATAVVPGCAGAGGAAEGGDGGSVQPPADGAARADARVGQPCVANDPADGPAGAVMLDDAVIPGGVWGEPMDFHMADWPLTWAISLVHASMLLRDRCLAWSPNAVLSVAIKESRLGCAEPGSLAAADGCFQIESTSAYLELQRMFPTRFADAHADVVSGDRFESAALTLAHYLLFSSAMFRKYEPCPEAWFAAHPDPTAGQKVRCFAYNRGLWSPSLPTIFQACADRDPIECFASDVATDHARAIVAYTGALDAAAPYDVSITWDDLVAYWQRVRVLYPDADEGAALAAARAAFDAIGGGAPISFRADLRPVLRALIDALPPFPTVDEAASAACSWSYLSGTACDPGGGCPPSMACDPDPPPPACNLPDAGIVIE
jgi:hypothetical protein